MSSPRPDPAHSPTLELENFAQTAIYDQASLGNSSEAAPDRSPPQTGQNPANLAGFAYPNGLDAYPENLDAYPEGLDAYPDILDTYPEGLDALVESLVQTKLQDSKAQLDAESASLRKKEASLINREIKARQEVEALKTQENKARQEVEELKAQLASAERAARLAATAQVQAQTGNAGEPRKRRRQQSQQSTIPDLNGINNGPPAHNTRSMRRATLQASAMDLQAESTTAAGPGAALPAFPSSDDSMGSNMPVVTEPDSYLPAQTPQQRTYNTRSQRGGSTAASAPAPTLVGTAVHGNQTRLGTPAAADTTVAPRTAGRDSKVRKKAVVKAAAEVYRYLPQDRPKDLGGLQTAMHLHIRILWGLVDSMQTPARPPAGLLNAFNNRFSNEGQLLVILSQESSPALVPLHLVQVGLAMSAVKSGITARQARLVEEHMLGYMQACLSRFGLDRWCPDLQQSAYSLYNAACRLIALNTFRQALVSHTYIHLSPNVRYTASDDILIKLYDHFVFYLMYNRYMMELRAPGVVRKNLEATPVYLNRMRLAAARLKFLEDNNYPLRYRNLIKTKATSDDEYDSNQKVWLIKRRPERSPAAEAFIRLLDRKREAYARQTSSRAWKERVRIVPTSGQKDSAFQVLPDSMPIDYFDPDVFNGLQPRIRHRIALWKVAFLPLESIDQSLTFNHPDERLGDVAFTRKYGKDVFERYRMVRKEDLANDADDEEEDDEENDNEWLEEDDMDTEESGSGSARTDEMSGESEVDDGNRESNAAMDFFGMSPLSSMPTSAPDV